MIKIQTLKKRVPVRYKYFFKKFLSIGPIIGNYWYDLRRFLKYSSTIKQPVKFKQLQSRIIASYHVVEKGLSMPERRLEFGKENIQYLISLIRQYDKSGFSKNDNQYKSAISALKSYVQIHEEANINLNWMDNYIDIIIKENIGSGGIKKITENEIKTFAKGNFKDLAFSRNSIRNFSSKNVTLELINEAIQISQRTPSVCNRQSVNIYVISEPQKIKKALSYQNGNRGFGHLVNKLLIVTSSLTAFNGINERNQSFIDGGMYSMSLLYALHYLGLGACPLNWSAGKKRDQLLRKNIEIEKEDNVIMMIGIGHLLDEYQIANSERKNIKEIIKYL